MPPAAISLLCAACGAPLTSSVARGLCPACVAGHALTTTVSEASTPPLPDGLERIDELGRGGMGVVVLAFDPRLNRYVALKRLADSWRGDNRARERFLREARAAAQLAHPGIVRVLGIGESRDDLWFTMEYVEGGDMSALLERRGGRLPWDEAVRLVMEVADAVHHAHGLGIAHRDLKPSNILIGGDGRPKVCDFGLAALTHRERNDLTQPGELLGTPAYLAPEALDPARNAHDATSADIYALGAVLFHLVTGRPPFVAGTSAALYAMITSSRAPGLSDSKGNTVRHPNLLDAICARCLEKNPGARFRSAGELADALRDCLKGHTRRLPMRPQTLRRAGIAALALVIGAAGVVAVRHAIDGSNTIESPARAPLVVVRPVVAVDGEETTRVFAAGLMEDLIAAINRICDLRVISAHSARAAAALTPPEASVHSLNATIALEVSVQRFERKVRVVAHLVDITTGAVVWTRRLEQPEAELSNLQTNLAIAIARELRAHELETGQSASRQTSSRNRKAWTAYLEARALMADSSTLNADLDRAEKSLQEAVAADPGFALAYAKLSQLHMLKYAWTTDRTPARLQLSLNAAEEALRLNPDLPEAKVALAAYFLRGTGEFDTAIHHLERALVLSPHNAEALALLGNSKRRQGDFETSADHYREALALDPLNANLAYNCADTFLRGRNYEEASRILERSLTLMPANVSLVKLRGDLHVAWTGDLGPMREDLLNRDPTLPRPMSYLVDRVTWLILENRLAGAVDAIDRSTLTEIDGQSFFVTRDGYLAITLALDRRFDEARAAAGRTIAEVEERYAQDPYDARLLMHLAELRALLGRVDEAVELARRTLAPGDLVQVDAFDRGLYRFRFAVLLATHGRRAEAAEVVKVLLSEPNQYSAHWIVLHPAFRDIPM